ncbi:MULTISPECIES: EpsG family protein [Bacillus]|uniref:EpsG family protein n=1 Tax=Bacillus TaxID=1386 RepID=UPI000317F94D|nr:MULTISPECIES: EpsG family protein [Bacillus]
MLIYLLLPLAILYCLFLSRLTIKRKYKWTNGEIFTARSNTILILWALILLGLAAFKGVGVGVDYPMYYGFFLHESYTGIEPGISFFYDLAVKYENFFIFSIGTYALFIFFMFYGIKKNSPNYLISLLFFLLTYVYLNSYNQLRQLIAVSIIFCFVNILLSDKKIKKWMFICIILLALLFHNSAIFMFCLFLIPKKPFNRKIVIPLFLLTIVLYFIPEFKNVAGDIIIKISGVYAEKYTSNLDFFFEVNKEKGLLQLMPVIIQMFIVTVSLYLPKNELNLSINYGLYQFSTNAVVINLWLYSIAGIESVDRIQLYFSAFNIYYYSILIHLLLNSKNRRNGQIFMLFIVGFWMLYYVLRLFINIAGVVPYSFFS